MSEDLTATGVAARPSPWQCLAVAAVVLVGLALLFAVDPAGSRLFPRCPLFATTGLYCPGCGTSRALHQILHGNLSAAFRLNPLMVLLLPPVAYGLLGACVRRFSRRRLPTIVLPAVWIWALLGVVVLYWVLRNIPAYPLNLLAPAG